MNLANTLTLCRIGMIPLFVLFALYYAQGVKIGSPQEWQYWLAVGIFAIAAISDGIDGFIARRLNQRTRLGSILDPIADKALMTTTVVLLSWDLHGAFVQLPLWFPILIISRDILVVLGVTIVFMMGRGFDIEPNRIGKIATALQMLTIGIALLRWETPILQYLLWGTGLATLISGITYIRQGVEKLSPSYY